MSSMRLCLLGPPRLEREGVPLEFDTRKNLARHRLPGGDGLEP